MILALDLRCSWGLLLLLLLLLLLWLCLLDPVGVCRFFLFSGRFADLFDESMAGPVSLRP